MDPPPLLEGTDDDSLAERPARLSFADGEGAPLESDRPVAPAAPARSLQQNGAHFGDRYPIQHLTPAADASLPITARFPRTLEAEVELFAIDVAEMAARYAPAGSAERSIDTEGLSPIRRWTSELRFDYGRIIRIPMPPEVEPGLYIVSVREVGRETAAQTFLIHHEVALVAQRGRRQLAVWAARPGQGGAPAEGMTLRLHDAAGAVLDSDITDAQGVGRLDDQVEAAFVSAESPDGGVTITGLDARWQDQAVDASDRAIFAGHVHSDRPIYRPGQRVHYKATLRRFGARDDRLLVPTGAISVTIRDARGNRIEETNAELDAFGSIAGSLLLGDEPALGDWRIEVDPSGLELGDERPGGGMGEIVIAPFLGSFQVAEYVRPDYAVTVEPEAGSATLGQELAISVRADYYFGSPVAGAELILRLMQNPDAEAGGQQLASRQVQLDEAGAWSGTIRLDGSDAAPGTWALIAEVTDASRRPVAGRADVTVHRAALSLGLELPRRAVEIDRPHGIRVTARDHAGRPRSGLAVDLELSSFDGQAGDPPAVSLPLGTGPDGTAEPGDLGLPVGRYLLLARAWDDAGVEVQARSELWLYPPEGSFGDAGSLLVETDREAYSVGDTAQLLVRAPEATWALLLLEREEVYLERSLELSGSQVVEIPIEADFAPSVTARLLVWSPVEGAYNAEEARLSMHSLRLAVSSQARQLSVEIVPAPGELRPGDRAGLTLRVRDADGRPVAAQFSLALVDASLLALAEDRSGSMLEAFWGQRADAIEGFDTLQASRWVALPPVTPTPVPSTTPAAPAPTPSPPSAATSRPGTPTPDPAMPPRQPNLPDDEAAPALVPRRDFPETAYWNPRLETGPDGELHLEIELPDNLTTWRAIARAIDLEAQVGRGEVELVVNQPISADPALPRFAVVGDEFAIDVLAHNRTGAVQAGTCSLEASGYQVMNAGERELELGVAGPAVASWSVVASQVGMQTIGARLISDAGQDAVEHRLETQAFGVPERFVRAGSTEDVALELFELPFKAVPEDTQVEIRLTPRLLIGILDGVGELAQFPYGCVEQTMTKMLPNAVIDRLSDRVELPESETLRQLPEFMRVGLQKLYGFQLDDGSWGWWQGGRNLYITSWVLHGLVLSEQAGHDVDDQVLERGLDWLEGQAGGGHDPQVAAYALYVLAEAGRPRADWAEGLLDGGEALDSFSLASLVLALDEADRPEAARRALDRLIAKAEQTRDGALWPMGAPANAGWHAYHWDTMASDEKSTAMAMLALGRLEPDHRLLPEATDWLLAQRTGAGWDSTQSTAFGLLALGEQVAGGREASGNLSWTVRLDDWVVLRGSTRDDPTAPTRIVLGAEDLRPGPHRVEIEKQGGGRLHYVIAGRMTLYQSGFESVPAEGLGIQLQRAYQPVDRDRPAGADWHVGELINVRLTVDVPEAMRYLMIEDKLPAGLEAIDTGLNTESPFRAEPGAPWRWSGYERKEVHDEGVIFFAGQLSAGRHVFDYPARAITPGRFSARPAEVYAMYRPEVWGRSGSQRVAISPERVVERPDLAGDLDRDCRLSGFDAALVADAWSQFGAGEPAAGSTVDLNGDARLDAADIALAARRAGTLCGDRPADAPSASAGSVTLRLVAPAAVTQGDPFWLEIRSVEAIEDLGAWDLAPVWLEGAFQLDRFEPGPILAGSMSLGPSWANGRLRVGAFDEGAHRLPAGALLARLRLRAQSSGELALDLDAATVARSDAARYAPRIEPAAITVAPRPDRRTRYLPGLSNFR